MVWNNSLKKKKKQSENGTLFTDPQKSNPDSSKVYIVKGKLEFLEKPNKISLTPGLAKIS